MLINPKQVMGASLEHWLPMPSPLYTPEPVQGTGSFPSPKRRCFRGERV